ncbi:MAG: monovalent cation/H(+) antiporter subunit G [Magnetococcales bacterium]|nr:monovalent cation/H(+) antiporter subunit G [Magnetococcales bacterium]
MAASLEILSWFCFLVGGGLCITGGVGVLRFPDFFTRVHAASVTETLATPLLLIGLMLQLDNWLDLVKALYVLLFVLITGPTAAHALAKGALHHGSKPVLSGDPKLQTGDSESNNREDESSNS